MNKFQIAIRKIGVHFSKPIWSFIRNCVFWLWHLNKISAVRADMKMLKTLTLDDFMKKFLWQDDVAGDWTPWGKIVKEVFDVF